MSEHNPIRSCCTRPRFNAVGGVDDCALHYQWNTKRLVDAVHKIGRTAVFAFAGVLAALAIVYAYTLSRL